MRFDDRLLTVLNQPAADRHDAAVRWRQLVDLVARAGPNSASPVVAQALASIRSEAPNVEASLRAAAARAVAALPLPLGLLECFAADSLTVSAPIFAAATLDPPQWRALLAIADEETRHFVEALHPELSAPPQPDRTEELIERARSRSIEPMVSDRAPSPEPTAPDRAVPGGPSLSEVVARIERRRRNRAAAQQANGAANGAVPAGAPALFRWECGPSGDIAWVEGAPRGPLIGRSIARAQDHDGDRVSEEVARAFAVRAPFRDATITLSGDGPVAGDWKVSGVPAFEPTDGRFAGYRGVALREVPPRAPANGEAHVLPDPDSLRELVHEIKTPLNAIIGFAEIINGQYLGPADRGYRERANEIVAQARLLLGAIDDLDFAAKIQSSGGTGERRVNLAALLDRAVESLRELAAARETRIEFVKSARTATAAVEPELADRLLIRLCAAVIDRAQPGEQLRLSLDQTADQCRVSIGRPMALRGLSDTQLFDPAAGRGERHQEAPLSDALSLRLVRGLARLGGADLVTSSADISLVFPRV